MQRRKKEPWKEPLEKPLKERHAVNSCAAKRPLDSLRATNQEEVRDILDGRGQWDERGLITRAAARREGVVGDPGLGRRVGSAELPQGRSAAAAFVDERPRAAAVLGGGGRLAVPLLLPREHPALQDLGVDRRHVGLVRLVDLHLVRLFPRAQAGL